MVTSMDRMGPEPIWQPWCPAAIETIVDGNIVGHVDV